MALDIGANINQYKIVARLGKGGMGEVYLAQDARLGRKVALKLLFADVTKNEDWILRFQQEARAASSLNHPNIITIYEVGQTDESHFISTEFIEGVTLRQYLKQNSLTTNEVLDIVIQISGALVAAHGAGIIHRDIKPENVMLRPDGYVKVVDFGLAKFTEQPRSSGASRSDPNADTEADDNKVAAAAISTNPGMVMGTISYMSPEQATGNEIDARTDIFSLGVLLYEMLSGRLPFEGATPNEIIVSIIHKKQRPLVRFAPDIPSELERIVEKSLTKKRDDRYQSLKDMQIDLRRLKRQLELKDDLIDLPESIPQGDFASGRTSPMSVATGEEKGSTKEITVERHASSAEYIVSGLRQHKKTLLIATAAVFAIILGVGYYMPTRPIDSIAVLPFTMEAPETGTEFGDDMTENIRRELAKLPGLRVMSSSIVQQYKAPQIDPKALGRELNVRAILLGKVSNRRGALLVSAELIDTRDGHIVWSVLRRGTFSDSSLVPNEIVAAISEIVGIKFGIEDKKKHDAETLYVKGRNAWNKRTTDSINEAMRDFEQALELYPSYALAYAGLADCHNMLGTYGAKSPKEAFPKAHDAAIKALAIDNNLAEGHAALAYATFRGDWNWPEAEKEFKKAISLNDDYPSTHQWYANFLAAQGRFEEAIKETRRTQELDKSSLIINSHFGLVYYFKHDFDDAIKECKKTVELDPSFFVAHRYLGLSYAGKEMYKEAVAESAQAVASSNRSPLMRAEYTNALALSGDTNKAQAELADLLELSKQKPISPYHIAAIYVGLKDKDRAFEWLEKAFQNRADWMVFLKVDPRFDSLHADARFTELLRRMNL